MSIPASGYVMGHSERERKRLALQASILEPFTEHLLRRAGISTGMRVLDLGCGVGDVSLLAARLVGRQGSVTSVDMDAAAMETAKARAAASRIENITFVQGAVDEFQAERPFDAVMGRHILIHLPDPLRTLKNAHAWLRPGGVAVFQEYDFAATQICYPPWPLREEVMGIFRDFLGRMKNPDMGMKLFHFFLEAGFTAPDCRGELPIDGGAGSQYYELAVETLRSILPHAQASGIGVGLEIDTLLPRLRDEGAALRACFPAPLMVGGFARKP